MLFVIPREGKTYIGTTDTFYSGEKIHPEIREEDKAYILKCANAYFPKNQLGLRDIESCWAGLRPLINKEGKAPSEISRKDELFESPSGLITIAGGKLTGYRKMAQRVVDRIAKQERKKGKRLLECSTDRIILPGGNLTLPYPQFFKSKVPVLMKTGVNEIQAKAFVNRYGACCDDMLKDSKGETDSGLPLLLKAELNYSIEHEMCMTPSDFFIRRTGMLYFNISEVRKYETAVIALMSNKLGWNAAKRGKMQAQLDECLRQASGL
jgi:glycerol-3-phosphate dehydrogenase